MNTSYNLAREPIAETLKDTIKFLIVNNNDALPINEVLLIKADTYACDWASTNRG